MSRSDPSSSASDTAPEKPDRPLRGAGFMVLGVLFIAGQEGVAKLLLEEGMPLLQVIWARYTIHLVFMLAFLLPRHGITVFKSARPKAQIGRSLLLVVDTLFYFSALAFLSLVEVTAIVFIAPILVVLLSAPLLGERLSLIKLSLAFLGFGGVLLIAQPFDASGVQGLGWPALLVVAAAFCIAFFNIATRLLRNVDPNRVTMVYTALVGTLCATVAVPFVWQTPDLEQWGLMIGLGLLGGIGHGLFILAHQEAPASTVAPFMYVQILWALGLGWVLFGDWPGIWTGIGAGIIILSGLIIAALERRKSHSKTGLTS